MREFHAECVKNSRIWNWLENKSSNLRAFTHIFQLALAVLNEFQNRVDGLCHLFKIVVCHEKK